MATFEAKVYKIEVEPHPNADKLELAKVGDFRAVIGKGSLKTGDLCVYIQEGSVVPDWLISYMNLEGKLAGSKHNRVKAIKLRDALSQGLVLPVKDGTIPLEGNGYMSVCEGQDVATELGITKYEPVIPTHFAGQVGNMFGYTLNYDIENVKKYPDIIADGSEVVFTEKLHGTWTCFGYHGEKGVIVTSKGLSKQGVSFKMNEENANNTYVKMFHKVFPVDSINYLKLTSYSEGIYLLGEIFGAGIQDLTYGYNQPEFRLFDVYLGTPGSGRYLNYAEKKLVAKEFGLTRVPTLYKGPFSKEVMIEYTNGMETVSNQSTNIREGIVITPTTELSHNNIGRVVLKSVSEAYLLRKGKVTEFN